MVKTKIPWTIINQNSEGIASDGAKGSEEHFIRKWSKGDLCQIPAESLVKFSSAITWKVKHIVCMNLVIWLGKFPSKTFMMPPGLLFSDYSKMWEEKKNLRKELLKRILYFGKFWAFPDEKAAKIKRLFLRTVRKGWSLDNSWKKHWGCDYKTSKTN